MSEENNVQRDGLEVVPNEKKTVEVERVWERNPSTVMPEIVPTETKQTEMPETVANEKPIDMPEVVASENKIVMPETAKEEEPSKKPEVGAYAALFAKYAQEPVKEEPAKEEPIKVEPVKEEAKVSEPAPAEPVKEEPAPEEVKIQEPAPEPVKETKEEVPDYDKNVDIKEYEIEEIEEIEEVEEEPASQEIVKEEPVKETAPVATPAKAAAPTPSVPASKPEKKKEKNNAGTGKRVLVALLCAVIFGVVSGVIFIVMSTVGTKVASNSPFLANFGPTPAPTATPMPTPTPAPTLSPEEALLEQEDYLVGMIDEAMKSVVSINVIAEISYYGQVYEAQGAGSGIIVNKTDSELLIATNYHVIEDTTDVSIQFCDGSTAPATVKGKKVSSDLAICSVELASVGNSTMEAIRIAKLGDSNAVRVGQTAIAIGNALGSGQSVTKGVISALNREITTELNETGRFLQTDAPINHGNSGGALLNIKGEVIGINESKRVGSDVEGMGFAIPISDAIPVIEELSKDVEFEILPEDQQAMLGIVVIEIKAGATNGYGIAIPKGVYINEIDPDSPAEKAGLQKGDIICEFNGMSVTSNDEWLKYLASTKAGSEVDIMYRRFENGQYVTYHTTVTVSEKVKDE